MFRDLKALVAEVFMFSIKYGADFMKWSSSQVSRFTRVPLEKEGSGGE